MGLPEEHADSRKTLAAAAQVADENIRAAVRDAAAAVGDKLVGDRQRLAARAVAAARTIGDALAGAVAQSRAAARTASGDALGREFAAAGGDPSQLGDVAGGDAEDEARGAAVGETFAAAWLDAFNSAMAGGGDPREAARRALEAVEDERVPRIALTEAAHAFAAERDAVMRAYARKCRAEGRPVPTKTWVCVDKGDCLICFALCGTTRAWDEPWTTGTRPFVEEVVPGQVHPNCLCSAHVAGVGGDRDAQEKRAVHWPEDLNRHEPHNRR